MIVHKGGQIQVTKNIEEYELFSNDSYYTINTHYLDDKLPKAIQFCRDYYDSKGIYSDCRVKINSTVRTIKKDIELAPNVKFHTHPKGIAVDWKFYDEKLNEIFQTELKQHDYLFKELRKIGITGFGLEGFCTHFDTRDTKAPHEDEYGFYAEWTTF